MFEKVFLGLNVLIWMGYGTYCFFVPEALADSAALVAQSATATTELRAMYGGLQFALGELCLFALLRPAYAGSALLAIAFATSGLGTARVAGLLMDGGGSEYTYGAIGFELVTTCVAWWLVSRTGSPEGALA